jgi:ribonucleoside-diphosphate reductase alpha chain
MGDSWTEFEVLHPRVKEWKEINNISDVNINNPYIGSTAPEIDWIKRIKIQSIVQKYVTHSISSTINLPKDVTLEKVSEIYLEAWKMKLKGITVYRDGSRNGVLLDNTEKNKSDIEFRENNAPKRPKKLKGEIHRFQNNLEKWIAVVGMKDGRPYEIFTGVNSNGLSELPSTLKECEVVKNIIEGVDTEGKPTRIKRYDIEYIDSDGVKQIHTGLNQAFNPEFWNYAKLISGIMRHGMPILKQYELIDSLNFSQDYINTWKNGVARTIKKYIKDGEKIKGTCPECGSEDFVFEEGCIRCKNCSWSKCG